MLLEGSTASCCETTGCSRPSASCNSCTLRSPFTNNSRIRIRTGCAKARKNPALNTWRWPVQGSVASRVMLNRQPAGVRRIARASGDLRGNVSLWPITLEESEGPPVGGGDCSRSCGFSRGRASGDARRNVFRGYTLDAFRPSPPRSTHLNPTIRPILVPVDSSAVSGRALQHLLNGSVSEGGFAGACCGRPRPASTCGGCVRVPLRHIGPVIVVSGETAPSDDLVELARGADVLVHDALYVPGVDRIVAGIPNATRLKESSSLTIRRPSMRAHCAGRPGQDNWCCRTWCRPRIPPSQTRPGSMRPARTLRARSSLVEISWRSA